MSEEKQVEKIEIVDKVEHTHVEKVHPVPAIDSEEDEGSAGKAKFASAINPVVFLLFMILAMVVVLVVTNMRRGPSASNGSGVKMDDPAVSALKADLEARRSDINRQRLALNLPPLEGASEPIDEIAKRLKADADTLVGLASRFQEMLGEKDAEVSQRNGEILRLEKLRQDILSENSRLQSELQRALVGGSEAEQLKTMLTQLQTQRDAYAKELADTRAKLAENAGAIGQEEFIDLERRYEETTRSKEFFENRVKELEAQLGNRNLFAKSENELLPAAVELFRRLRALEGLPGSDNNTEYSKLGVELDANVLHVLKFTSGSSELTAEEMTQLDHIAAEDVPDGDLTFIVGYASKTGDATANQKLSSDRATAAAEYFAGRKRPDQGVQAVYLGQTDRFSSDDPALNQICEVWRIRKK